MKSYALIDGDVIAFHACPYVRHDVPGQNGVPVLDENGDVEFKAGRPVFEYSEAEDEAFLALCWENLVRRYNIIIEKTFSDEAKCAVKGPTNFRDEVHDNYKGHRDKSAATRNNFVPALRLMMVEEGLAIEAQGMEADDYLRIWAEECRDDGDDFTICSVDKDLKCIPGKYFNMKTDKVEMITPEFASRFYYEQLLKGDSVDNIPGLPGVGPKRATSILADCNTEEEFQIVVQASYREKFGDNWHKELMFTGQLIYILKHEKDRFSTASWPKLLDE
jgi:hypothetical protein